MNVKISNGMKIMKNNWHKLFLVVFITLLPVLSLADGGNEGCVPTEGKICNPLGSTTSLPLLIHDVLTKALQVGIPIIALAIIYSGFLFVFARGNSEKLTKAKDTLLYTLIGAAILLGSWAIATIIKSTVLAL